MNNSAEVVKKTESVKNRCSCVLVGFVFCRWKRFPGSKLSLQMGDKGMQDDEEQLVILGNVSN